MEIMGTGGDGVEIMGTGGDGGKIMEIGRDGVAIMGVLEIKGTREKLEKEGVEVLGTGRTERGRVLWLFFWSTMR